MSRRVDGGVAVADMAITQDLASPHHNQGSYDLAWSSCAGTALANTCVEKFFAPFVACFQPSGTCSTGGLGTQHTTWTNGAVYSQQVIPNQGLAEWFTGSDPATSKRCLAFYPAGTMTGQSGSSSYGVYCPGDDPSCFNASTGTTTTGLRIDSNGIYTCADGTQVDPKGSSCAVLSELLDPVLALCGHP